MLGLSLRQGHSLHLECHSSQGSDQREFNREALKAFRKFKLDGKVHYTCNVARLHACNRLGSQPDVNLWRTHFFLMSEYFDDTKGAVFSCGPGNELIELTLTMVDVVYIALGEKVIVNPKNGYRISLDEALIFASTEDKKK